MTQRTGIPLWTILPLYFAVATAIGFADYHSRPYPDLGFTQYVPGVIAGTAEPPGRYRVLAPYVADAIARHSGLAPVTSWLLFRWVCLFASLLAGHLYLHTWFDSGRAVAGNMMVMALMPLTFTNSWPNPDQFTELALFTLGCTAIARGWWWTIVGLVALNALNRETSAFLVMLLLVSRPLTRPHLYHVALAGLVWAAIYAGLRAALGFVAYDPWQFWRNIGWLTPLGAGFPGYKRIYGWFFIILLVPCFVLAARAWRTAPRFVSVSAAIVAPAYLVVACLFSSTIESRIFTPMLPLLAPAMLFALFPDRATAE